MKSDMLLSREKNQGIILRNSHKITPNNLNITQRDDIMSRNNLRCANFMSGILFSNELFIFRIDEESKERNVGKWFFLKKYSPFEIVKLNLESKLKLRGGFIRRNAGSLIYSACLNARKINGGKSISGAVKH